MTAAAKELEGLGPASLKPRLAPKPPEALGLGPEDGYVLSRVDGQTSLGDICLLVPFEPAATVAILRKLWLAGAIELEGRGRPSPPTRPPAPSPPARPPAPPSSAPPPGTPLPPRAEPTPEHVR